jgi:hypothetical protein
MESEEFLIQKVEALDITIIDRLRKEGLVKGEKGGHFKNKDSTPSNFS